MILKGRPVSQPAGEKRKARYRLEALKTTRLKASRAFFQKSGMPRAKLIATAKLSEDEFLLPVGIIQPAAFIFTKATYISEPKQWII